PSSAYRRPPSVGRSEAAPVRTASRTRSGPGVGAVDERDQVARAKVSPREDNLRHVGHAVTPLEVAVPERVAVLDLLHADIQHVAEPQRVEVRSEEHTSELQSRENLVC